MTAIRDPGHDDSRFDYAWLVPHWLPLHWLYHFTERHPWAYRVTKPLWWARYRWLSRMEAWL